MRKLPLPALRARTHVPQKLPRINPQLMAIVPFKFQRILANRICGNRFRSSLKHDQLSWLRLRRLPRLPPRLAALFVAKRARAGVAQEGKCVRRKMSVLPLNLDPGPRLQMDFHGFRVGGGHGFQYRITRRWSLVVRRRPEPKPFTAEYAEIAGKNFRLAFLGDLCELGGESS